MRIWKFCSSGHSDPGFVRTGVIMKKLVPTVQRFPLTDCITLEITGLTYEMAVKCGIFWPNKGPRVTWPLQRMGGGGEYFAILETYEKICWPQGIFIHQHPTGSLLSGSHQRTVRK